jgi:transposase, IS30 family
LWLNNKEPRGLLPTFELGQCVRKNNCHMKTFKHLCFEERFVIEKLLKGRVRTREIARFLGRSPNTVSREIRKNMVKGEYWADKAHHKAYFKRWRSKRQCLKVAMDLFLHRFVDEKLRKKWSPEQISGYLLRELGISCSAKAVYKFARRRCYDRYLFWGWNKHKGGKKQYQYDTPKDGRKYIDERPELEGQGNLEMDFIVSRQSTWVLLVLVDRLTRRTWVRRLPNRKRGTIRAALSLMLSGIEVTSITTDNDIAFVCWKDLEILLNTRIYFTHPYHSWEKGLVENTNRWIRCFVPKRRDIESVTQEELDEIHAFLNDRPRAVIGFAIPSRYYQSIACPN